MSSTACSCIAMWRTQETDVAEAWQIQVVDPDCPCHAPAPAGPPA
jgi:hypothetical protein